jgi:hypothetical protein
MSSGRAPYFFFHFARKLGWPNISASRTRAVLPIMDWQRIAFTARASTAMSIKTSSLLRVTCVTRARSGGAPRMIEASVPTPLVRDPIIDRLIGAELTGASGYLGNPRNCWGFGCFVAIDQDGLGHRERPLRGFETASDHGRRSCDGGPSFAALLASADQAAPASASVIENERDSGRS